MLRDGDYLDLFVQLLRPPPRVLGSDALLELLVRHDPPDDPAWPTPAGTVATSYRPLLDLFWTMGHVQQVVGAVTAAEQVLPIFERWSFAVEQPVPPGPRRALRQTLECLDGLIEWDERIKAGALAAQQLAIEAGATAAAFAASAAAQAYAAVNAEFFAASGFRREYSPAAFAAAAVDEAFHAWLAGRWISTPGRRAWEDAPQQLRDRFFERWWSRVRCRLCFVDALTAPLQ